LSRFCPSGSVLGQSGSLMIFDQASSKTAIRMVSAWVCKNYAVFGQLRVDDKAGEITAIPNLLKMLQLSLAAGG